MTDWAAKVLEGVDKYTDIHTTDDLPVVFLDEAVAAIAKLAEGDGLVERLLAYSSMDDHLSHRSDTERRAAAHIAALTAQNRELALDVLASSGQAQEAYAAQLAAEAERDYTHGTNEVLRAENQRIEAERDALRAKVARLEGALHNCVGMLDCLVAESGRSIEWDQEDPFRMGEWFEPDDIKQLAQARAALIDRGK